MDFKEDLKMWKWAELEFMELLSYSWQVASIEWPQGKFPDYDIKAKMKSWAETTYEVKRDWIYPTSKCIWIEYECKGVPSGIMTSKADYYVYKLWLDFYFAKKGDLLELLMKSTTKVERQWGDDGTSKLRVIPEQEFYTVAKKIWQNKTNE